MIDIHTLINMILDFAINYSTIHIIIVNLLEFDLSHFFDIVKVRSSRPQSNSFLVKVRTF